MNKEFKNWVLNNSRKVMNADYRGLTMLYMVRKVMYNPSTLEAIYKYVVINKKFYDEVKDDPQNTLMYNDKRFSELGDGE
jgi:hypothetical protein